MQPSVLPCWLTQLLFLFYADIRQEQLETVVPKQEGALVLIVAGKYKGQVNYISFLLHLSSVLNLSYLLDPNLF